MARSLRLRARRFSLLLRENDRRIFVGILSVFIDHVKTQNRADRIRVLGSPSATGSSDAINCISLRRWRRWSGKRDGSRTRAEYTIKVVSSGYGLAAWIFNA